MRNDKKLGTNKSLEETRAQDLARLGIALPDDVKLTLNQIFSDCNRVVSRQISIFPNTHEETLDQLLVTHLAQMQGPIKFDSGWIMRFDAHFIGGGRHYRTWEVADIGLMVVFRKKGKIVRSKLVFLQSKRLYASTLKYKPIDPYHRMGMGRLLVTDDEHQEVVEKKTIKFSSECRYKAIKTGDLQYDAMEHFSNAHDIEIFYLFYNPVVIPWSVESPVEILPEITDNNVGCRVVPRGMLDRGLANKGKNYSPTFSEVESLVADQLEGTDCISGWRLEYFVNELFISCKKGKIDDSPNFELLLNLMNQKSSPISSAISISFDLYA